MSLEPSHSFDFLTFIGLGSEGGIRAGALAWDERFTSTKNRVYRPAGVESGRDGMDEGMNGWEEGEEGEEGSSRG